MRTPWPRAHQAVVGGAARHREIEIGAVEQRASAAASVASQRVEHLDDTRCAGAGALKTPPLNRTRGRAGAPVRRAEQPARCARDRRVGGDSGRPSSRQTRRGGRACGPGARRGDRGKKPSTSTRSTSARVSSVRMRAADHLASRGRAPRPAPRRRAPVAEQRLLGARGRRGPARATARRRALCRSRPARAATAWASARSMLSPPSRMWSPTATRSSARSPSSSPTAISVKSVVPPPTSHDQDDVADLDLLAPVVAAARRARRRTRPAAPRAA